MGDIVKNLKEFSLVILSVIFSFKKAFFDSIECERNENRSKPNP